MTDDRKPYRVIMTYVLDDQEHELSFIVHARHAADALQSAMKPIAEVLSVYVAPEEDFDGK